MNKIIIVLFLFISSFCWAQSDMPYAKNEKAIKRVGDVIQLALPVAAGASTIILWDKEGAWQFVKSFGTTMALTYGLKYLINKPRPDGATDGHAFPSGHTASAFGGAAFIQKRYGWTYGAPAYALAGICAYTRLQGNNPRHDGWDIVGGIVVGVGSTYLFTTPYQKEHLELSFSSGNNEYLLGMKYKF